MKRIGLNTDRGRHAAWLELFFDLAYVVALTRLTHIIVEGHDGNVGVGDYLSYFVLFVPVWWSWVGHTMYQNRFGVYDLTDSLLTLLQMFFAMMLAFGLSDAFGASAPIFALAYAATRWILIFMYMRVHISNPEVRPVTGGLARGFGAGSFLWGVSVLFPAPIMYGFWVAGIMIELATPLLLRKPLSRAPVHNTHLPERVGLFALLVIGESFLGIVSGADHYKLSFAAFINLFFAFSIICAIWWVYFETLEKALNGNLKGAAHLCIYGHLPIYMGIGLLAAGVKKLVAMNYSVTEVNLIFLFSLLLILLPLQMIYYKYTNHKEGRLVFWRGVLMLVSIFVFVYSPAFVSESVFAFLVVAILLAYIQLAPVFGEQEIR